MEITTALTYGIKVAHLKKGKINSLWDFLSSSQLFPLPFLKINSFFLLEPDYGFPSLKQNLF
jgi:hypothetical protein